MGFAGASAAEGEECSGSCRTPNSDRPVTRPLEQDVSLNGARTESTGPGSMPYDAYFPPICWHKPTW